jgi:peptidyl-prolyl cis-trans isomerase SurA
MVLMPARLLFPAALAGALVLAPLAAKAEIVDGVAAVVNGDVITISELEERVGPQLPPPGSDGDLRKRRDLLLKRAVEDAVADKLLEKEAESQGLMPTAAEIDNAVDDVKRANGIDDQTLETALKQQGLSKDHYREMLKLQLTRMKVVEYKVKSRVTVSEDDVKARYGKMSGEAKGTEEVHARDMYLPKGDDAAGVKAKLVAARKRVEGGVPFAKVAEEVGGPLSSNGGDLGWLGRGAMLPELEKVAFTLKNGEMSEIVDAAGGYHLVLVEDRRLSGAAKPLAEARDELRQQILSEKLQKATEEYIAELRRSADVELKLQ